MRRDRLISLFVVLAAVTIATVVVWLTFFRAPERTPGRSRTTVLVSPPLTPLQAKRAKRTSAAKAPDSRASADSSTSVEAPKPVQAPVTQRRTQSRSPAKKRKVTPAPSKPQTAPQQPSAAQPTPEPEPQPGVTVTVPLPHVCLPPVVC